MDAANVLALDDTKASATISFVPPAKLVEAEAEPEDMVLEWRALLESANGLLSR